MARKGKSRSQPPKPEPSKPAFPSPFKDLRKMIGDGRPRVAPATTAINPPPAPSRAVSPAPQINDEALFREAMDGARPLSGARKARVAIEPRVAVNIVSEESEVLAELYDLVSGQGPFELTETEEYVEGARNGIDPRVVSRLRRGEFALQGHIDLHGMVREEAKRALTDFIIDSLRKGRRAILVVHGRGHGSPGGRPILKHLTARWLSHGVIGGYVLAFTSARPNDGGAGAMYVLLRRERRRGQFEVLKGTHGRD